MIYSLTGEIIHAEPGFVVIECGGVGYKCIVSNSTMQTLPPVGNSAMIYTHMNITQDAVSLFGFASSSEIACFRMLTGVSGIGSKTAIAILSALSPEQIAISVAAGDYKSLTRAQGVGPKQAQRIVLELKDKVTKLGAPSIIDFGGMSGIPAAGGAAVSAPAGKASEAISALMVLGYDASEAAQMVAKLDPELTVEQMIAQALRSMAPKK